MEVISTCSIRMANSITDPTPCSRVDLIPWDLQLLLVDPIQKGILFHKHDFEIETFINHLKTSLSRTLDLFPPLAGRLAVTTNNDDNTSYFHVDCNNAGALFTHAVARGVHLRDIIDPLHTPIRLVRSFFPLNDVKNYQGVSEPMLGVQVTELIDGFFVGCSINHSLVDGTSFWHFFNSWSELSRGLSTITKKPVFFEGSLISDFYLPSNFPIPVPSLELKPKGDVSSQPLLAERVFRFGKEKIAKLKAIANLEAETDKISSLQALIAHIWRAVMRIRGVGADQQVNCLIPVGARTRLPGLPEAYFGNAVHFAMVVTENENLMRNGLGWVALEVHKTVATQTREELRRGFEDLGKNLKLCRNTVGLMKTLISISSSPRHNVYGVDFGWGKPVAVRSGVGNKHDGQICLYPAAEAGGIDVEACLTPETMVAIGDDAQFMEHVDF